MNREAMQHGGVPTLAGVLAMIESEFPPAGNMAARWTQPFQGVQHLVASAGRHWATVSTAGDVSELACWYPGCGFNPQKSRHPSAESARAAGEAWMQKVDA